MEDGVVKIIFVKSEENMADIFMKNFDGETFEKHTDEFMMKSE